MSVYVSDFDTNLVTHDDAPGGAHSATIDPTSIKHTINLDGSEDHDFLIVECPVCGSVSTHPVGGGAQPPLVQELFVRHAEANGCPCPEDFPPTTTRAADGSSDAHREHVRAHAEAMDGPGRWQAG